MPEFYIELSFRAGVHIEAANAEEARAMAVADEELHGEILRKAQPEVTWIESMEDGDADIDEE